MFSPTLWEENVKRKPFSCQEMRHVNPFSSPFFWKGHPENPSAPLVILTSLRVFNLFMSVKFTLKNLLQIPVELCRDCVPMKKLQPT